MTATQDPVEYQFFDIAQMGSNPKLGLPFARGGRRMLRQDSDVMVIGEIRDKETAEIAIQFFSSQYLLSSTLHTNNTPYMKGMQSLLGLWVPRVSWSV